MMLFFGVILTDLFYISPSNKPKFRIALLEKHHHLEIYLSNVNGRKHDRFNDVVSLQGNSTEMNFEYYNICGRRKNTIVKACVYQKKFFKFQIVKEGNGAKFKTDENRYLKLGDKIDDDLYYLEMDKCFPNDQKQLFVLTALLGEEEQEEKVEENIPSYLKINRLVIDPSYLRF